MQNHKKEGALLKAKSNVSEHKKDNAELAQESERSKVKFEKKGNGSGGSKTRK